MLNDFYRLGANALEIQLYTMRAKFLGFDEWNVGLRHFHGFVKLEILLIIFLIFFLRA
jgi:hypothetical protein